MALNFATISPSVLKPSPRPPGRVGGRHFVQFYEQESALVSAVGTFLTLGLAAGEAAIVIAEPDHREAIERALGASGIDIAAARSQGAFASLDARESLDRFMEDGGPDPAKFKAGMEPLIESASDGGRKVRIFGEMVAVLWRKGLISAAIRLEELWNDLSTTRQFHLFCAYPTNEIGPSDLAQLGNVCHQHSQVITPEMQASN